MAIGAFVAGGAIGGVVGAELHARLAEPAVRIVYVERAPAPIASAEPAPANPPASSSVAAAAPSATAPIARVVAVPPASASPPSSQLDAERLALDHARAKLTSGDGAGALELLAKHEHDFAHPWLAEEREALSVQALVKAGRYVEARARAEEFRRRAPNSLFLPAVDAAIESIP
jgi:hypothetical protein